MGVHPGSDLLPKRLLRLSALFDLVMLVLLLWMPPFLFDLFGHPPVSEPFLFRLSALPLLMAPVVYLIAAEDPSGRPHLVRASFWLRVVGAAGIALLLLWHRPAGFGAYLSFVFIDLIWAILYRWAARRAHIVWG